MSYSRWGSRGSGYWYTYWICYMGDDVENYDNASFCIQGVTTFNAQELRKDMAGCMEKVKKIDPEGDIEELELYAREFLADVDDEYNS